MAKTVARGGRKARAQTFPKDPPRMVEVPVTQAIERMVLSKQSPINLDEFAVAFYEHVGGPKGFAEMVMNDYRGAEAGSPERARASELVLKLFNIVAGADQGVDTDTISDEDLEIHAMKLARKMGVGGVVGTGWIDHVCI